MSRWTPCKRRDFIRRLRKLGFDGPYSGARHQFMIYEQHRLAIPSSAEYSVPQLRMMNPAPTPQKTLLFHLTYSQWQELLPSWGESPFRAAYLGNGRRKFDQVSEM